MRHYEKRNATPLIMYPKTLCTPQYYIIPLKYNTSKRNINSLFIALVLLYIRLKLR